VTRRSRLWGFGCGLAWLIWPAQAEAQADTGRDFPKTLTLDEPGVDDELSLPTVQSVQGRPGGQDTDIAFEIDKRVTEQLQVQVNIGYRTLQAGGERRYGWDDAQLTGKYVVLDNSSSETIVTLGATRAFGGSGAAWVGAAAAGSTTPTLYFGQGLGATGLPVLLRPFAITGTFGYQVSDRAEAGDARLRQVLQIGTSLQYSLHYLSPMIERSGLPAVAEHLVAIIEMTYAAPMNGGDAGARQGFAAPGLIYAGDGYQLALESLVPLTRISGRSVGAIAQLNLSFATLGLGGLAKPLW
jgi:hypothetical protein